MGVASRYKQWRHTRGYGVHSPFAYEMVNRVIRPGRDYAWYGYADIDNSLAKGDDGMSRRVIRRQARMLLRLASFLQVRSAFLPKSNLTTAFYTALKAMFSKMRITPSLAEIGECELVASSGDYVGLDILCELLKSPGRILALKEIPAEWLSKLFEALPEGVILYGNGSVIAVHRPGMQKVAYSVNL